MQTVLLQMYWFPQVILTFYEGYVASTVIYYTSELYISL